MTVKTVSQIREYALGRLSYDERTGVFTWKNGSFKGQKAGNSHHTGYTYIWLKITRRLYGAHRLAWLFKYGTWPTYFIDHINNRRDDNRIVNLRECSLEQNSHNRILGRDSTSGYKGVSFHKPTGKWQASISVGNRQRYLGLFTSREEAAKTYQETCRNLRGEFAWEQPFERGMYEDAVLGEDRADES